jgi:hypothetical protein
MVCSLSRAVERHVQTVLSIRQFGFGKEHTNARPRQIIPENYDRNAAAAQLVGKPEVGKMWTIINGIYDLYDGLGNLSLTIRLAGGMLGPPLGPPPDGTRGLYGDILDANSDTVPIQGNIDVATGMISFSSAVFPGDSVFGTFYTGFVFNTRQTDAPDGAPALAGTWQRMTFRAFDRSSGTVEVVSEKGGWYANNFRP